MRRARAAAVAAFVLLLPSRVAGAPTLQELRQQDFRGWDGIAFYCTASPADDFNKATCDWAGQRLRVAASSARISAAIVPSSAFDRAISIAQSDHPNPIELELELLANKNDFPFGIYVGLRAKKYYSRAAESPGPGKDPREMPRSGDLIFWEQSLIAAGTRGPDMASTLRQAIETQLLRFVSDFTEARAGANGP